jgi:DNA-binding CsgD family transcriptional regulator
MMPPKLYFPTAREKEFAEPVAKALLSVHAALDLEALWKAVQRVINASIPDSVIGLTLQHNPVLPMIAKWTRPIGDGFFNAKPLHDYLRAHPRSRFVRISEVFPGQRALRKSEFYRNYMALSECPYAIGLLFWRGRLLMAVIVIMRTAEQGDLTERELGLLRYFYPQFQTAIRRLRSLEHEHAARMAFEEFLGRLPLPTILLQWNLKTVYLNKAAREFCELWKDGPEKARIMKGITTIPPEILDRCRVLKKRWEHSFRGHELYATDRHEVVRSKKWPQLRAAVDLRQLDSTGVARPQFFVECEELNGARERAAPLPHLTRLTRREQQVARLVCEGQSNQEIADQLALSLAMVKKHLHAIFRKLEVNSRSRLMAMMR